MIISNISPRQEKKTRAINYFLKTSSKKNRKGKEKETWCDVCEEEVVPSKKPSHKEDLDLSNKRETETV